MAVTDAISEYVRSCSPYHSNFVYRYFIPISNNVLGFNTKPKITLSLIMLIVPIHSNTSFTFHYYGITTILQCNTILKSSNTASNDVLQLYIFVYNIDKLFTLLRYVIHSIANVLHESMTIFTNVKHYLPPYEIILHQ